MKESKRQRHYKGFPSSAVPAIAQLSSSLQNYQRAYKAAAQGRDSFTLGLDKHKVLTQNQSSVALLKEKSLSYHVPSPSSTALTADHT